MPSSRTTVRAVVAAILLGVGVALGIAGLFPSYLGGASLAGEPAELVPHAIYLAAWAASGLLILLGGARPRAGALLGIGTAVVTFGLFFADAGLVMAGSAHLGAGLVLSLASWLGCAAGSALALLIRPATPASAPVRPQGRELAPIITMILAGLGAAIAFAPSWDSYTLRTSADFTQSLTAGNAFANPAPVMAGDVAVMAAVVAVVIAAGMWRQVRYGAALLVGVIIPMAAQAISALVQLAQPASPTQFGISPAQATQLGLTITSGLTLAFWIFCAFVLALVLSAARMLITPDADGLEGGPGQVTALRRVAARDSGALPRH